MCRREVNFITHAKSVSVWQQEFSKIVDPCTFGIVIYARKYTEGHKMDKNKPCDNLGTPRIEN